MPDETLGRVPLQELVGKQLGDYSLKRILVALDGTPMAELALPIAKYLAGIAHAQIDLLRARRHWLDRRCDRCCLLSLRLLDHRHDLTNRLLQRSDASFEVRLCRLGRSGRRWCGGWPLGGRWRRW
jgi:hypothetical protein